jgi:hypothetical protein
VLSIVNCAKVTPEGARAMIGAAPVVQILIDTLRNSSKTLLHIEIVSFFSTVCVSDEVANNLNRLGIVDLLVNTILSCPDDVDMQVQCLFAFYRMMPYDDPRVRLLRRTEIFPVIARAASSQNEGVSRIGCELVEAIEVFDPGLAENLRFPIFDTFNGEWIEAIRQSPG